MRQNEPRPGMCLTVDIVRIEDADTIEVSFTRKFSVRLLGPAEGREYLDAPEKNTPEGEASLLHLIELLTHPDWPKDPKVPRFKRVKIFIPSGDNPELMDINSWSRLHAEVWDRGEEVGTKMLDDGHAVIKKK